MTLTNKTELKRIAAEASKLESATLNPSWRAAYRNISVGASMLWRLIEQGEVNESGGTDRQPHHD